MNSSNYILFNNKTLLQENQFMYKKGSTFKSGLDFCKGFIMPDISTA